MPKAAAAAKAPTSTTFKAPLTGGIPVIRLLKYPKINRQINVTTADICKPSIFVFTKK